ncbi:MAG TPA: NAD(P)/FAD-dependent oxidoreductase, partial [Rhodanobacteraceae bacterium]
MEHTFDYLVVGAGMAGEAAAQALRDSDANASIGMLGAESHPPYDRPPLTKKLWKDGKEADIWRPIDKARAAVTLNRRAVKLDPAAHTVHDDKGDTWKYRKLLIATGGTPRKLAGGDDFIYYRTFDDYQRLRKVAKPGARIVVVGGGFIGSEIAAAMAMNDCKVTMVFPEDAIGARAYPESLADAVTAYYREKNVDVRAGITVKHGERSGGTIKLTLSDGTTLEADAVVAGLGITP